jgi:cytochrome c oxidase assembly protein subunit 15
VAAGARWNPEVWPALIAHRLAVVTAVATLVLIVAGGLVTNTGSALAVPDWPTTFGHNMFLYPLSGMVGGVLYEHGHRLIGALVGVLTVGLAVALWREGGVARWLGVAAIVAVIGQGTLGGLRVILLKDTLGIVHGTAAQAFFALIVAIAFMTSAAAREGRPGVALPGPLALVALAVTYLQIVFGALLTHAGWLQLHLAGALAVYALVPTLTARLRRSGDPLATRGATVLLALLGVQLVLGVAALVARFEPPTLPAAPVLALAVPGAHRLVGSLILGTVTVLALRCASAGVHRPGAPALVRVAGALR